MNRQPLSIMLAWLLCLLSMRAVGQELATGGDDAAQRTQAQLDDIINFDFPKNGYRYTLAAAAKGIKIEYRIVVTRDYSGVIPLPFGPSYHEPAGPSSLHPREKIAGGEQSYCLMDFGLAQPPPEKDEVAKTLIKNSYAHSFQWDGRNWIGPSDTNNPKGPPFPPGTYELFVTVHGKLLTDQGKVPYRITGKTKLVLE